LFSELINTRSRQDANPWDLTFSRYERRRYAATLAALRRARYVRAFEPGCAIGELTALLASRCDSILATDISLTAARRAVVRCADFPGVEVNCADMRLELPAGPFDLIVFSEMGYYFDPDTLGEVARRLAATLGSGGDFLAVHWLGNHAGHARHGARIHELLRSYVPLDWIDGNCYDGYIIDRWTCRGAPPPA
jgi:SAM-dependent methyltransferase